MLAALEAEAHPDEDELERRLYNAMRHLNERQLVRWISVAPKTRSGHVWDHYPFTDEQWKARANMAAHHGQYPLPTMCSKAPGARVVVIGVATQAVAQRSERTCRE
jgi:hypothetical protein